MDIRKMAALTGWRRSIAIYHVMEASAEELGMTREAALEKLSLKSRKVAARTASNVKNLIEFFGSEKELRNAFHRLEPYMQTPQKLWYAIVTLAENHIKDPTRWSGNFEELKGIGKEYAALLDRARDDRLNRGSVHIRVSPQIRDLCEAEAKKRGITIRKLVDLSLARYFNEPF